MSAGPSLRLVEGADRLWGWELMDGSQCWASERGFTSDVAASSAFLTAAIMLRSSEGRLMPLVGDAEVVHVLPPLDYVAHWDGKPTEEDQAALREIVKAAWEKMADEEPPWLHALRLAEVALSKAGTGEQIRLKALIAIGVALKEDYVPATTVKRGVFDQLVPGTFVKVRDQFVDPEKEDLRAELKRFREKCTHVHSTLNGDGTRSCDLCGFTETDSSSWKAQQ
jgi:hypothetical protein